MGGYQSNYVNTSSSESKQDSVSSDEYVDMAYVDDLLIDILSFLPYKDIIHNCRLVCKKWRDAIDGHSVWKTKCDREFKLPVIKLQTIPDHYYRALYLHCISEKNLVKNPCGEESSHLPENGLISRHRRRQEENRFAGWKIYEEGGDGFVVENPPNGADPVPAEVGSQSCFATSYAECRKYQMIDLYEKELYKFLLNHNLSARIKVGEWYAARFDCACKYELMVYLLDEKKSEIDHFKFNFSEQQWNGKEWHLVTHEFNNVANVRYVRFEHSGQDRQFWAGHYGIKMTGSFVELLFK